MMSQGLAGAEYSIHTVAHIQRDEQNMKHPTAVIIKILALLEASCLANQIREPELLYNVT